MSSQTVDDQEAPYQTTPTHRLRSIVTQTLGVVALFGTFLAGCYAVALYASRHQGSTICNEVLNVPASGIKGSSSIITHDLPKKDLFCEGQWVFGPTIAPRTTLKSFTQVNPTTAVLVLSRPLVATITRFSMAEYVIPYATSSSSGANFVPMVSPGVFLTGGGDGGAFGGGVGGGDAGGGGGGE